MGKIWIITGLLSCAVTVAIGAVGAHAMKKRMSDEELERLQTGVRYQMSHSLGMVILAGLALQSSEAVLLLWAAGLLFAGIILFCGSMYMVGFTGNKVWARVAPVGGTAFMAGWVVAAVHYF